MIVFRLEGMVDVDRFVKFVCLVSLALVDSLLLVLARDFIFFSYHPPFAGLPYTVLLPVARET
jgi:hypothetical protein